MKIQTNIKYVYILLFFFGNTVMACPPPEPDCYDSSTCPSCYACVSNYCQCTVVNNISLSSGPYYVGDTATVSIGIYPTPYTCSVSVHHNGNFDLSNPPYVVFNSPGEDLYIGAKTSCQANYIDISLFDVVQITTFSAKTENFPKCIGESISKSDFNITTNPTGYEDQVQVTGLDTSTYGEKTAYATLWNKPSTPLQANYTVVKDWIPDPAPTGTITCTNGQIWDHILDTRDSIPLSLNAIDHDKKWIDGEYVEQTGNYIDLSQTDWIFNATQGYCSPAVNSATTNWYAADTSQPVEVKARLADSSTVPSPYADDDTANVYAVYTNLHGFKVGVRANFNGCWSGNSGDIWEDSGNYSYSNASTTVLNTSRNGTSPTRSDEKSGYYYVSYDAKTEPSNAVPAGNIKADLQFGLTAYWYGFISDCDLWDEDGDRVTIGMSFSSYGVGGGFSYSWSIDDNQEGIICGDWGYTTNTGLGEIHALGEIPLFEHQSGDYPENQIPTFPHTLTLIRSATKEWEKGDYVRGQYDLSVASYATDHCAMDVGNNTLSLSSPVVKIENVWYTP